MNKSYNTVLLDWDGTLARTLDVWLNAYQAPLRARGIQRTDKVVAGAFGEYRSFLEQNGVSDVDAAFDEHISRGMDGLKDVALYPDATVVLRQLKSAGKATAVVSSSPRRAVHGILDKNDMHDLLDIVICAEDVENLKPDPECIHSAVGQLGGQLASTVIIGDSDKDILAAQNAGINSILFYPPDHELYHDLESLRALNPTYIIHDFREVLDIVIV